MMLSRIASLVNHVIRSFSFLKISDFPILEIKWHGWSDGWMDKWKDGQTVRWTDRLTWALLKMQSRIYEENGCRDSQVPGHLHFSHYNINKDVSWKSSTIGQTDGRTDGPAHPPIEIKSYIKCLKIKKKLFQALLMLKYTQRSKWNRKEIKGNLGKNSEEGPKFGLLLQYLVPIASIVTHIFPTFTCLRLSAGSPLRIRKHYS